MAASYAYKVKDRTGQVANGVIEGDSISTVVAKLRQMGYTVINVNEKAAGKTGVSIEFFKKKVKNKDITVFSRQFATMISSGLSLTKSLNILSEQTENPTLAEVLLRLQKDVEAGQSLSEALAAHPNVFNSLFINMVKAGETGGVLDEVLLRVAEHFEKDAALKSKIKSAMAYPMIMFIMSMLIVFAMITFIVPVFVNMFDNLGGDLPLPTKILVFLSDSIRSFWYVLVGAVMAIRYAIKNYRKTPQGKLFFDTMKLKLPVFGVLNTKMAVARFTRTFGTLVSSGVPILQGLDIVSETANSEVVSRAVKEARISIKEGETIAKPLGKSAVFPPMVVQMIAVGEETGALDEMLTKIADFYDQEVTAMVEGLTSLIEPLMIGVMGLVIGGIIISLYLPMFKLITLIG
ncbi:MAG TPA: type II secretion system F family protein [Actinobacteria bacterium]|nr:type II secretion system F family protein [Actinomycetota bacterium]